MFRYVNKFRRRRGFTLIELLIVVTMVISLATIAVGKYTDVSAGAYGSKVVADMRTIDTAIAMYISTHDKAPSSLNDLVIAGVLQRIPIPPTINNQWNSGGEHGTAIIVNSRGYRIMKSDAYKLTADGTRSAINAYKIYLAGTVGDTGMSGWFTVEGLASGVTSTVKL